MSKDFHLSKLGGGAPKGGLVEEINQVPEDLLVWRSATLKGEDVLYHSF